MDIKGNVFVVTGGGNGIGREVVYNLLSKGASVAAVDINEKALKETDEKSPEHSGKLSLHVYDITDKADSDRLAENVIEAHGKVDGVINNAGIVQPFVDFSEMPAATLEKIMAVNYFGLVNMTKAFLPYLKKRPKACIVNVSSMGGLFPVPGQTIYGASKAAVLIFSQGLSYELKKTNIDVSTIIPGGIESDIMVNSGLEVSSRMKKLQKIIKLTSPKKAAAKIVRSVERNRYRRTIGADAAIMDFICRMSPNFGEKIFYKLMDIALFD